VVDNQNPADQWLHRSNVCRGNLFLGQRGDGCPLAVLQVKMEELIEGTLSVAAESLAVNEAVLAVELERWLERRAGTGLQRKARIPSLAGLGDDVIENRGSDSLS